MWFKQTINNACGLIALLHALCNGEVAKARGEGGFLVEGGEIEGILREGV